MNDFLFSSESVTEGHPDKMADQISDAILDAYLTQDDQSRVACETLLNTGLVMVSGEISSKAVVNLQSLIRKVVIDIGYDDSKKGFDGKSCAVLINLDQQSQDIAQGVNVGQGLDKNMGAGDQGLMFGYATDETEELMPLPIQLAHRLAQRLAEIRKNQTLDYLYPDGKAQVCIQYKNNQPTGIHSVVISSQHQDGLDHAKIKKDLIEHVIRPTVQDSMWSENIELHINPTGRFVIGGPLGDAGLTGRKIIVDTYGGAGRHGGGAFSGKDATKVDRSAAYAARYIAKNLVKAGVAKKCELQIAYCIGYSKPLSININTFGTHTVDPKLVLEFIKDEYPLSPAWIIEHLKLRRPLYQKTATYGHFGRQETEFTWEKTDQVEKIKSAVGL